MGQFVKNITNNFCVRMYQLIDFQLLITLRVCIFTVIHYDKVFEIQAISKQLMAHTYKH